MLRVYLPLRLFHSVPKRLSKFNVKEAKVMQKFMKGSLTKKRPWYSSSDNGGITSSMPNPKTIQQGGKSNRRVAVLNKLFMKHITDIMATGEVADELLGRGIEITRVKVAPDFLRVNVFWLAKGSKHDDDTENILAQSAGKLRHELSQLRLIGSVPIIEFHKDRNYCRLMDVDLLLAKADFGDDYIPVDPSIHLKSEFMLNTQYLPAVQPSLETTLSNESLEEVLPPMRSDVLGLNQEEFMMKIKRSLKKSQAMHRRDSSVEIPSSVEVPEPASTSIDMPRPREMAQFLLKRQRLKQKAIRGDKNYQPEVEMYENEILENKTMPSFMREFDDDDWDESFDEYNDYDNKNNL